MAVAAQAPRRMRKTLLGSVPLTSPFYSLHPVTRLVGLLVLAALPLFMNMPEANLAFLALMFALFVIGRVDLRGLRIYLPLIGTVAFFMFLIVIVSPDRAPGYIPIHIGPFTTYYQSLRWTVASYIRIMAMLFATILYFSTNHERDILVGLRTMKVPFVASYVIGLSVRAAGMFMEDFRVIRQAEQARGLDKSSLKLRDLARLYGMYLVPLFTIALRRAEEISSALFARGYTVSGKVLGGGRRHDYIRDLYTIKPLDWTLMALMVVSLVVVAYLQVAHDAFRLDNSPLLVAWRRWLTGGA
jgi:energy-coupling factor transporter transmembrane protein EcfT